MVEASICLKVNTPQDIIKLVNSLKKNYDVPVGIKIAGTHFMEKELEIIAQTTADFITIDGQEGGTAAAAPTLEDDMGLPTLFSIARTVDCCHAKPNDQGYAPIPGPATCPL